MSCDNDCEKPIQFPRTIYNRPGLSRIDYRIGSYAELREHMFELLNQDAALSAWTHRGADDPGIALLEGTAVVGDILTFYQQLYANESYLRTAQWRESVAELVRLLGYRLAPGLGGEATFALAVKGEDAVTVPKGFGLKAQLESGAKPAEFESTEEVTAYPALSEFSLYRPFTQPSVTSGVTSTFSVPTSALEGMMVELKAGDRLMLVTASTDSLTHRQIAKVAQVTQHLDLTEITIEGKWRGPSSAAGISAYKLGRSFRYFGYNAPSRDTVITAGVASQTSVSYSAQVGLAPYTAIYYVAGVYHPLPSIDSYPLDQEVDDLSLGTTLLATLQLSNITAGTGQWHFFERQIVSVTTASLTRGALSGGATVVQLSSALARPDLVPALIHTDIRSVEFHEVIGAKFQVKTPREAIAADLSRLYFYGDVASYQLLHQRTLMLARDDQSEQITVTIDSTALGGDPVTLRPLTLVAPPGIFTLADFPLIDPTITVYGNLVSATQGKTEAEVVLGSGDQRQVFQTFALPNSPLTYLLDETQTPAQVPQLTVYVDGIAWRQVDAFFNYGPQDAVYVVRDDEDGKSFVQFGDGKNGRCLSSGVNNVSAVFRVGSGAHGEIKDGARPSITGKLKNFDKVYLPAPVAIGAGPEDESTARVAAPAKMQSLGRMVSLADIEAEALALPHVLKVRATWSAPEGIPLVRLTVLTESGEVADLNAVRDSMLTFNRYRGPARYPIDVAQGIRQYVYLKIEVGYEAARKEDDVRAAIKQALGLAAEEGNGIDGADGLFGLNARQFGYNAHKSQVIGAVQNVTGVMWVKLSAAQVLNLGTVPETDPTALALPTTDMVQPLLACADDRLLALHATHLVLSLSKDAVTGGDA
jgi:hypothetical protein